ncbi:MAG: ABC transporter permease [Thiohalophilus sp.]|jgi:putative ABC transport system permease protein
MLIRDIVQFGWKALRGYPLRTGLMLLAMSIGVASVLMLTSLGEGARQYVRGEFASLGTNLVIVLPGRSETTGAGLTNFTGATPRDLTLDDARALTRESRIRRIAPLNVGATEFNWQGVKREVTVWGTTHQMLALRHWELARGKFLPEEDWERGSPVCVIGDTIRDEIFGARAALGQWIRLGDRRYRVIGVLADQGTSIGINADEVVIIPVASAQALFNLPSLFRILIEAKSRAAIPKVIDFVEQTLAERHQGERDVTVITQDAVLATFDRILGALTYAVAGIAAISLAVAGILIMNIMLVAVSQRTAEIGLLKALGAPARRILILILNEALLLAGLGGLIGLGVGELGSWALRSAFPVLQAYPPSWAIYASLGIALLTGIIFSWLPARQAARLDPVQALARH